MNNLYTAKGKFLLLSFAGATFCYAMAGAAFLFAGDGGNPSEAASQVSKQGPVPVAILKDLGTGDTKLMSVEDFINAAVHNPNLTADDIAKLIKLKQDTDSQEAQIKAQVAILKKLTEKKPEGPFVVGAIKQGATDFKSIVKGLAKPVISGITTAVIIGGVVIGVVWYYGGSATYTPPFVTNDDYKIVNGQPVLKDYVHFDSSGNPVSDKDLLCNYDGWVFNALLRPTDCPPLK